jgi:hypothetical protein
MIRIRRGNDRLRSTSHGRLNRIREARDTTVLGELAAIRMDDMRSRLAAVLIRNRFSSYDVVQYCWANAKPHVDLSNNSVAQWVERNES